MDRTREYLEKIQKQYATGIAREHAYRGYLQNLLEHLVVDVLVTNEPARIQCGAPDYILTKKNIPVGYIEAKDVGKPLDSKDYKEQFDRYRQSLSNLIITDYLDFWFFRDGERVTSVRIATIIGGKIAPQAENFEQFENLIRDFSTHVGQSITSPSKLSKMMAGKARLLAKVIESALTSDNEQGEDSTLKDQLAAFQTILIHDIEAKQFADIYSQTIAYGMFAARLHDPTLENFTRQEAAELIPKSNPFLRNLFGYIAGPNLDDRILWIVDELADIFRATDVSKILERFGKATQKNDPIIHFYETFLAEYDPKLRKSRGVWYTPEPVVNYIVRAVDEILINEFGIKQGLASTETTLVDEQTQVADRRTKTGYKNVSKEVHRVQILDPATGTGTFLSEVVKQIYHKLKGQQGIWSSYIDNHLIPRLNGFEILMASYVMAHIKLQLLLSETGYAAQKNQRFRIYLTNSLEEHHPDTGTLFASWLSREAGEANQIKRDTPVMVVMGNPPYSGISSNMGDWISKLIEDYKYVDGQHFGEKKHWLHDDYVKFIRYGQYFVDKNNEGILAYINNHSFLDNPTFRGMRWSLLRSFDKIYILDLHGSTKRHEVSPDGSPDNNVFDIQQGVSINIFVKTKAKTGSSLAKVYKADIWGSRESKYNYLWENTIESTPFTEITPKSPYYFFVHKDFSEEESYQRGFAVNDLFKESVTGVLTARDALTVSFEKSELLNRIQHFCDEAYSDEQIRSEFFGRRKSGKYAPGDTRGWKLENARRKVRELDHNKQILPYDYRPFDVRYVYYNSQMIDWGREKYMHHMLSGENVALDVCRQLISTEYSHVFVVENVADDSFVSNKSRERGYVLPLYLYPKKLEGDITKRKEHRIPNLRKEIVDQIAKNLDLIYVAEKNNESNTFSPIDIFDYIYAYLNSPIYRKKYLEFLKIDFPRIPFPDDRKIFWNLVKAGKTLRELHLMKSSAINELVTNYPVDGDNKVTRKITTQDFETTNTQDAIGRIWINDYQYFENIQINVWNYSVGGYKPAQKWLKDRANRELSVDEIMHYQRLISAITETMNVLIVIDQNVAK